HVRCTRPCLLWANSGHPHVYLLLPVACEIASLHGSLTSAKWSFKQASIRPRPGLIPAQIFLTSAVQAFLTARAFTSVSWQPKEKSLKRILMHAARPSPGLVPAQWVFMSETQGCNNAFLREHHG